MVNISDSHMKMTRFNLLGLTPKNKNIPKIRELLAKIRVILIL